MNFMILTEPQFCLLNSKDPISLFNRQGTTDNISGDNHYPEYIAENIGGAAPFPTPPLDTHMTIVISIDWIN